MGEKLSVQQISINKNLAKANYYGDVQTYSVKKKDNLWKIAKKNFNKKKVSQSDIQKRVFEIAKLNKLNTETKMNKLKVGQNLFVPAKEHQKNSKQVVKTGHQQTTSATQSVPPFLKTPEHKAKKTTHWIMGEVDSKEMKVPFKRKDPMETPWSQYAKTKPAVVKPAKTKPKATNQATNKNNTQAVQNKQQTVPQQKKQTPPLSQYKTSAEKSTGEVINTLQKDKTVKIEKGLNIFGEVYHVTNETTYGSHNYVDKEHMVTSFEVNKGKIKTIYLEDTKNIDPDGYDYQINEKGTIKLNAYPNTKKGQLTKEQNALLRNPLGKILEKAK